MNARNAYLAKLKAGKCNLPVEEVAKVIQ